MDTGGMEEYADLYTTMTIQTETIDIAGLGECEVKKGIEDGIVGAIYDIHESLLEDRSYVDKEKGIAYFKETYSFERMHYWRADFVVSIWRGDTCLGFGRAKYNGWVTHMFVSKQYQGYKLGKKILVLLEGELIASGLKEIYLSAEPKTVAFYEHNGWKKRGEEVLVRQNVLLVPMYKTLATV
jgi:GNAT superfamily N-acetyltransferase